jgi:hypothetical protein
MVIAARAMATTVTGECNEGDGNGKGNDEGEGDG